ncbi:hypothetical protein [Sphingobacterium hungaricum]
MQNKVTISLLSSRWSIKFGLFVVLSAILSFQTSCKKEMQSEELSDGSNVVFTLEGINEDESLDLLASTSKGFSNSLSSSSNQISTNKNNIVNMNGLVASFTLQESSNFSTAIDSTKLVSSSKSINKLAAVSILPNTVKYRLILYDKSTNPSTFVSSTLATPGTAIAIPVVKGKNYDWVAFSFNDNSDPGSSSTNIETDNRDLLHAFGTTGVIPGVGGDGTDVSVPIKITLKHKLCKITVEINAANYVGNITALNASLASANYFSKGTLDLKTGTISDISAYTVPQAITFTPATAASIKTATYYTAGTTAINPFSVNLNNISILSNSITRAMATTQPFTWTTIVPGPSKNYTAKIEFLKLDRSKLKIISAGSSIYGIYNDSRSGLYQALVSTPNNFGPDGIVATTSANWSITNFDATSGSLSTLNTGGYKFLYLGYAYQISAAEANAIIAFLDAGNTVFIATERPGSTGESSLLTIYAGTNSYTSWSYLATNTSNAVLNGRFGDARGKTIGNDAGLGYVMTNTNSVLIDVLASSSSSPLYVAFFKSKTRKLYWVGDGGFTVYSSSYATPGSANGAGSFPFLMNGSKVPYIGNWYTSSNVSNSTVVLNILTQALVEAQ